MFKYYLEDRIAQKGKEIELTSNAEKEIVQLKYKGNQKQFEVKGPKLLSVVLIISFFAVRIYRTLLLD